MHELDEQRLPTSTKQAPSRAELTYGFDDLPDGALISIEMWAAVQGVSKSTAWARIKTDIKHPRTIRLSDRCTRLRVGDLRAYLRAKQAGVPA